MWLHPKNSSCRIHTSHCFMDEPSLANYLTYLPCLSLPFHLIANWISKFLFTNLELHFCLDPCLMGVYIGAFQFPLLSSALVAPPSSAGGSPSRLPLALGQDVDPLPSLCGCNLVILQGLLCPDDLRNDTQHMLRWNDPVWQDAQWLHGWFLVYLWESGSEQHSLHECLDKLPECFCGLSQHLKAQYLITTCMLLFSICKDPFCHKSPSYKQGTAQVEMYTDRLETLAVQ